MSLALRGVIRQQRCLALQATRLELSAWGYCPTDMAKPCQYVGQP